jgi:HlyD family secretion protein
MAKELESLVRPEALDAREAGEKPEDAVVLAPIRSWIAFLALLAIIVIGLAWAVFGRVPFTVAGSGFYTLKSPPVLLRASSGGQVQSIEVGQDAQVKAGDVIAILHDPVVEAEVKDVKGQIVMLTKKHEELQSLEGKRLDTAQKEFATRKNSLERARLDAKDLHDIATKRLKAQEKLYNDGLIAEDKWLQSQQLTAQLLEKRLSTETELGQASLSLEQVRLSIEQSSENREFQILQLQAKQSELESQLERKLTILSPVDGTIAQRTIRVGAFVQPGQLVCEILPANSEVTCKMYVDDREAKKLAVGMQAHVTPSMARPERYGYIVGKVTMVSTVPDSSERVRQTFGSQIIAQYFMRRFTTPIRVDIELEKDPNTPSGLKWTTGQGYPGVLGIDTIVDAKIEYEQDRPIALLIPWLRERLGVY